MVNISYRLTEVSHLTTTDAMGDAVLKFNYRRARRFPGGGLYSILDDVRMVLQVRPTDIIMTERLLHYT